MSAEFDTLVKEVGETKGALASIITLTDGLAQYIRDHVNDPAALLALAADLESGQVDVNAAIVRNPVPGTVIPPAPPAP